MTALLAIQNDDYSILLSDRRITCGKVPANDQYSKSGMLYCCDGRFAYGFTGLAEYKGFRTSRWLADTIIKAARPGCSHQQLFQNITKILNDEFYRLPELSRCTTNQKKLTVVFAGWFTDWCDIYGRLVAMSNFEDYHPVPGQQRSVGEFREFVQTQQSDNYYSVFGFGNWSALTSKTTAEVTELVIKKKPREGIVNKAVFLLRKIADTPQARKTIGKNIDEIYIPHDPGAEVIGKYHTGEPTDEVWTPTLISVCSEVTVVPELILRKIRDNNEHGPTDVPRVKMNAPCPCRSGRRYKDCHGKKGLPEGASMMRIK